MIWTNPQIETSSVLTSQPDRLTAKSCQLCRNVTRVPARLRCVLAACRDAPLDVQDPNQCLLQMLPLRMRARLRCKERNVTRILPSCDDGLPRYQDQEHRVDALDNQDQGAGFPCQAMRASGTLPQFKGHSKQWIQMIFNKGRHLSSWILLHAQR